MITRRAPQGRMPDRRISPRRSVTAACHCASLAGALSALALLAAPPAAGSPSAPEQSEDTGASHQLMAEARQQERSQRQQERSQRQAEQIRTRQQERAARRAARHALRTDAQGAEGCRLSLEGPSEPIDPGGSALLEGRLTCAGGAPASPQRVTLFQHEAGTPGFTLASNATTALDGAYQLQSEVLHANSVFYVSAAGTRSARVRVSVAPLVTLKGSPASAAPPARAPRSRRPGARGIPSATVVTFSGTVTPAYEDATVVLQRKVPGARRWRLLGRAALSVDGTYAITHAFRRAGEVDVRVVVHHRGTIAAASQTLAYMTPPRQNPLLRIEASADPLTVGQPVTISGTLAGGVLRPVILWARPPGGAFTEVAQTTTDTQGSYSFAALTPLESTCYRVEAGSVRSVVLRERVAYRIVLATPATGTLVLQALTLDGSVTPIPAGHLVYLERASESGFGFHRVGVATVAADGSFSITQSLAGAGSARLRVAVPGDAEHYEAASDPFAVRLALR